MKVNVRGSALSLLLLVACNRPDSDLFGAETQLPSVSVGGSSGTAASTDGAGKAATTGGVSNAEPVAGTAGTSGAVAASGGSTMDEAAGTPSVPDVPVAGGAPDGVGGKGEPPPPVAPVCGNGILEAGEQCDDAGHTGQDGCDAQCKVVCSNFGSDAEESDDHHCYKGYDSATFTAAQEACVKRGGHLATISSEAENQIARGLVNSSKWIGGLEDVDLRSEGSGTYSWITGEPFTYTNWAAREPDQAKVRCSALALGGPGAGAGIGPITNENCYEHCVSMNGEGTWSDARCDVADGYLCEWEPAGTKP